MTRILSGPELADKWYLIKPYVEASLVHGMGDVTSYDLFIECLAATSQCWVREDGEEIIGVAITRILQCKQYKELVIVTTTSQGWFKHGYEILEIMENFARGAGCKYTTIYGRKGWTRALRDQGYREPYTILMKEL